MSPTTTDGFDRFFESVKDIRDRQKIYGKSKSISEMLDSHEKMRERQRLRDIAEATEANTQFRAQEIRLQQEQNRLLKAAAEAQEAERSRIALLPDCPECHAKIEGTQPAKCSHCGSRLFWLFDIPRSEHEFTQYLKDPIRCREIAALVRNLSDAGDGICAAASLLSSPVGSSGLISDALASARRVLAESETQKLARQKEIDDRLNQITTEYNHSVTQAAKITTSYNAIWGLVLLLALVPGYHCLRNVFVGLINRSEATQRSKDVQSSTKELAYLEPQLAKTEAIIDGAKERIAKQQKLRPTIDEADATYRRLSANRAPAAELAAAIGAKKAAEQREESLQRDKRLLSDKENSRRSLLGEIGWRRKVVEGTPSMRITLAGGLMQLALLTGVLIGIRIALKSACSLHSGPSVRSTRASEEERAKLKATHAAIAQEPLTGLAKHADQLADAHAALTEHMSKAKVLISEWHDMAERAGLGNGQEPTAIIDAMAKAESVLAGRMTTPPPRPADEDLSGLASDKNSDEASVTETTKLLLDAICVIASADGKLKEAELDSLSAALRSTGCPLPESRIREMALQTCRAIHRADVATFARQLCQSLQSMRGTTFVGLLLDLQQKVALADGRAGQREQRLMNFFQQQLGGA